MVTQMPRRRNEQPEPPRTFAWEDLLIWEERRDLLAFMLEIAGSIAGCEHLQGRARLDCVIKQSAVTSSTVLGWLTQGREPHYENLRTFAHNTGVPIGRLWLALRWTTVPELAQTLGRETPSQTLSTSDRQWLDVKHRLGLSEAEQLADHLGQLAALLRASAGPDAPP
jgi:hypothetical protein